MLPRILMKNISGRKTQYLDPYSNLSFDPSISYNAAKVKK